MTATVRTRLAQIPASRRPDSPVRGSGWSAGLRRVREELTALHSQAGRARGFLHQDPRLDEIAAAVREYRDAIVERMPPAADSDSRTPADAAVTDADTDTDADATALVAARLNATVLTVREVHDAVVAADPTSAELLYAIVDSMEMFAWMLNAEGAC
ncbi:MAG TPA: hypothetical protein VGH89_08400 [Pseudonocardia sp.]|jgi:starvation-inducible DNA-binding protein